MRYFFRTLGMALKALTRNAMRHDPDDAGRHHRRGRRHRHPRDRPGRLQVDAGHHHQHGLEHPAGPARHRHAAGRQHRHRRRHHADPAATPTPDRPPIAARRSSPSPRSSASGPQVVYEQARTGSPAPSTAPRRTSCCVRNWNSSPTAMPFTDQDVASEHRGLRHRPDRRQAAVRRGPVARSAPGRSASTTRRSRWSASSAPRAPTCWAMDQDDIVLAPWTTVKFKLSGQSAQTAQASASAVRDDAGDPAATAPPAATPTPTTPACTPTPSATRGGRHAAAGAVHQRRSDPGARSRSAEEITSAKEADHGAAARAAPHQRAGQPDDFKIRDMTEMTKTASARRAT